MKTLKKYLFIVALIMSTSLVFSCEEEELEYNTSIDLYDLSLEELMQIDIYTYEK